jgi:hypothetical protein
METITARSARPGDVVVVHGHSTGDTRRAGVIVEVLGEEGHEHFRVRWDEEHESLYWPGSDATLERAAPRRRRRRPAPVEDAVPDLEC